MSIQAGVAKHDQQGNPAADAPQHRQGAAQGQEPDRPQEPGQALPAQHRRRRPEVAVPGVYPTDKIGVGGKIQTC